MARRSDALVTPHVLKWARESTGFSLEDAARAAGISKVSNLLEAESGARRITFRQLRKLAHAFRLPLRVLYLSQPPVEPALPLDYRSAADVHDASPQLIQTLRVSRQRRTILLELLADNREQPPELPQAPTDTDIAETLTPLFCANEMAHDWHGLPGGGEALNASKALAETLLPVVVFESSQDIPGVRGCSVYEPPLSIVILNPRDNPNSRRFTLAHELAHIFMRESGICNPFADNNAVEQRCNRIASEAMLPRRLLEARLVNQAPVEEHIDGLAREFRMSHSAVAVRLFQFGALSDRRTKELLTFYEMQYTATRAAQREKPGGPSHYQLQAVRLGSRFSRAVLDGYSDGALSVTQTAELLGVSPSHAAIAGVQEWAVAAYDH